MTGLEILRHLKHLHLDPQPQGEGHGSSKDPRPHWKLSVLRPDEGLAHTGVPSPPLPILCPLHQEPRTLRGHCRSSALPSCDARDSSPARGRWQRVILQTLFCFFLLLGPQEQLSLGWQPSSASGLRAHNLELGPGSGSPSSQPGESD